MKRERHNICSHSTLGWGRGDSFQVTKLGQIERTDWGRGTWISGISRKAFLKERGTLKVWSEVRVDTGKGSIKLWLAPCEWRCRVYMWADLKLPHEGPRDVGGQGSEDHFTLTFLASLPFSKPLLGQEDMTRGRCVEASLSAPHGPA